MADALALPLACLVLSAVLLSDLHLQVPMALHVMGENTNAGIKFSDVASRDNDGTKFGLRESAHLYAIHGQPCAQQPCASRVRAALNPSR